jgi:uncharacterized RDD family membrane protein YckC
MNYWVHRGGQQYGPYSLEDLQRYVTAGNILPTDLARNESMSQWLPVSQVLAGGGQAPQPPAPQPMPQQPVLQQPVQQQPTYQDPMQAAAAPQPAYGQAPIYSGPAAAPYVASPFGNDYATWANRVIGFLIDSLFVWVVMAVLYGVGASVIATTMAGFSSNAAAGTCCLFLALFPMATLLVGGFNRVYLISKRGFSVGQGVMKLKVVDANGNLLTTGTAFIRLLAQAGLSIIPLLGVVDLLWPLWDERRQTLHDKAVNSYVINNGPRT